MRNDTDPFDGGLALLPDRLEEAEQQLDALRQQLEHAHRLAMLGTLAAGVVHEINNILTPVLAYAQMAGANPDDPKLLAKTVEKTIKGVSQATGIAESMLELAQPERRQGGSGSANVREVCRSALECLGRDPAKDGISCTMNIPRDLTCAIRPLALQQVILNLLINAVDALKSVRSSGPRRLTITASRQTGHRTQRNDHRYARIDVADTGPGIPEEIQAGLFTPFVSGRYRPSAARQGSDDGSAPDSAPVADISLEDAASTGSGLGLSVCRTLIEASGGTITAASAPDAGTTFTILLPVVAASSRRNAE